MQLSAVDMIAASALAAALHMAKHGVTFCVDHHSSPYAIDGSLETIARALEKERQNLQLYLGTDLQPATAGGAPPVALSAAA